MSGSQCLDMMFDLYDNSSYEKCDCTEMWSNQLDDISTKRSKKRSGDWRLDGYADEGTRFYTSAKLEVIDHEGSVFGKTWNTYHLDKIISGWEGSGDWGLDAYADEGTCFCKAAELYVINQGAMFRKTCSTYHLDKIISSQEGYGIRKCPDYI